MFGLIEINLKKKILQIIFYNSLHFTLKVPEWKDMKTERKLDRKTERQKDRKTEKWKCRKT